MHKLLSILSILLLVLSISSFAEDLAGKFNEAAGAALSNADHAAIQAFNHAKEYNQARNDYDEASKKDDDEGKREAISRMKEHEKKMFEQLAQNKLSGEGARKNFERAAELSTTRLGNRLYDSTARMIQDKTGLPYTPSRVLSSQLAPGYHPNFLAHSVNQNVPYAAGYALGSFNNRLTQLGAQ